MMSTKSYLILTIFLLTSGCATRSSYKIEYSYVSPIKDSGEVRTLQGVAEGRGVTKGTMLVEYPRVLKQLVDIFIKK